MTRRARMARWVPWARGAIAATAMLALTACVGAPTSAPSHSSSAVPPATASSGTPSPAPTGELQHIVVIVDENKPAQSILGNPQAPYLNALAASGAVATDYSAVTHPSLPNYLALTSGTTGGITSDCNPPGGSCLITGPNLAERLDAAGLSWRMYAEGMPQPCTAANAGRYAVKHNPFLHYPSVTSDPAYCAAHDVPYGMLAADLSSAASLPAFSFISPDLCDDMHDCSIATGDAWLATAVPAIVSSPAFRSGRSLLIVTFDEGDAGDNRVACVFAGPAARAHTTSATPYGHYALLRTIEDAWGLEPLGADAQAAPMDQLLSSR